MLTDGYRLATDTAGSIVLVRTEPSPAPLEPEITALEAELDRRGYASVLTHYRDAVDGLLTHRYSSANGDLRTALEELVTRLAEVHGAYQRVTGPAGQPRANQGGAAITHMVDTTGRLPADDGGMMLRGLWRMLSTSGPHPGQSDVNEARWRLQLVTATARFLLSTFRPEAFSALRLNSRAAAGTGRPQYFGFQVTSVHSILVAVLTGMHRPAMGVCSPGTPDLPMQEK